MAVCIVQVVLFRMSRIEWISASFDRKKTQGVEIGFLNVLGGSVEIVRKAQIRQIS